MPARESAAGNGKGAGKSAAERVPEAEPKAGAGAASIPGKKGGTAQQER